MNAGCITRFILKSKAAQLVIPMIRKIYDYYRKYVRQLQSRKRIRVHYKFWQCTGTRDQGITCLGVIISIHDEEVLGVQN